MAGYKETVDKFLQENAGKQKNAMPGNKGAYWDGDNNVAGRFKREMKRKGVSSGEKPGMANRDPEEIEKIRQGKIAEKEKAIKEYSANYPQMASDLRNDPEAMEQADRMDEANRSFYNRQKFGTNIDETNRYVMEGDTPPDIMQKNAKIRKNAVKDTARSNGSNEEMLKSDVMRLMRRRERRAK